MYCIKNKQTELMRTKQIQFPISKNNIQYRIGLQYQVLFVLLDVIGNICYGLIK